MCRWLCEAMLVTLVICVGFTMSAVVSNEKSPLTENGKQDVEVLLVSPDGLEPMEEEKRASVFRYGKRGVFRYGKRAPSVFRYGKRSILDVEPEISGLKRVFRYGKRSDLLAAFDDLPELSSDKRVFRYGKRGYGLKLDVEDGNRNEAEANSSDKDLLVY